MPSDLRRGRWWPCICRRECAHAPAVLSYTTGVGDQVPGRLTVHPRVYRRHPELTEADVVAAWEGALVSGRRPGTDRWVVVGADRGGRLVEMVAVHDGRGHWLVFHAMTPPSGRTLEELGAPRRTRRRP